MDCPNCGSDDVAVEPDSATENLSGAQRQDIPAENVIKSILMELAEEIYHSKHDHEIWARIIDKAMERLKKEPLKVRYGGIEHLWETPCWSSSQAMSHPTRGRKQPDIFKIKMRQ